MWPEINISDELVAVARHSLVKITAIKYIIRLCTIKVALRSPFPIDRCYQWVNMFRCIFQCLDVVTVLNMVTTSSQKNSTEMAIMYTFIPYMVHK